MMSNEKPDVNHPTQRLEGDASHFPAAVGVGDKNHRGELVASEKRFDQHSEVIYAGLVPDAQQCVGSRRVDGGKDREPFSSGVGVRLLTCIKKVVARVVAMRCE